jgi:hypothetical protein
MVQFLSILGELVLKYFIFGVTCDMLNQVCRANSPLKI